MIKHTSIVLMSLLVFAVPTALATTTSPLCTRAKVAGSYIRYNSEFQFIDQLVLHSDGTAYWYQSTAPERIVVDATFIPEVGTWKCVSGTTLVVTHIGATYVPESTFDPNLGGNVSAEVLDSFDRITSKFSVINHNSLTRIRRVEETIALTDDPSDPNVGTVLSDTSIAVPGWKRVIPLPSKVP